MNTLSLCCCKCQLICAFFDLICYITIPICVTIAIAAIAKSPVRQQRIRNFYDYKKEELKSKHNDNSSDASN